MRTETSLSLVIVHVVFRGPLIRKRRTKEGRVLDRNKLQSAMGSHIHVTNN
jgi:hypothetical protein